MTNSEQPFTTFKRLMFKRLETPKHLNLLDRKLEALETIGGGRLIVSIPPRHGKTLATARFFPAWYLGRHPDHRIILASYAAKLAYKNSRLVRNLMLSPIYQIWSGGVRPAHTGEGAASVQSWDIADHDGLTGGGIDAVGVSGAITGLGAHLIIVDDPVRGRADAESHHLRDKLWDWFTDDLYTRREPGASVVVVMTRWHTDDLVGRLLRHMPADWEYIRLPALAEADDPLGRAPGQPLWETRFSLAELEKTRALMGDYAFAGLYQQQPVPMEGNLFRERDFVLVDMVDDAHDPVQQKVRFWDLAYSDSDNADYSVGVLLGGTKNGRLIILDVVRVRVRWNEVIRTVKSTAERDGQFVPIGIENAAGGRMVVNDLLKHMGGFSAKRINVHGDKRFRALPLAARVGEGLVSVVQAAWTRAFIDELLAFPYGLHDDQLDSAAGALAMLTERGSLTVERLRVL